MFVMSVQGDSIDPGTESDTPNVSVEVTQNGEFIGSYLARPTVIPVPGSPGQIIAPQLFVVAFFAEEMAGQKVDVIAEVSDRNGDKWCSEGSFEVGTLIDAPPL